MWSSMITVDTLVVVHHTAQGAGITYIQSWGSFCNNGINQRWLIQPGNSVWRLRLSKIHQRRPGSPARLGRVDLESAFGWRHSLLKQLVLNCWDFLLRSLVIFLVRYIAVLDFVFSVQRCREVDRSISGAWFWGGRPSDGGSRTCGIPRFIHPSGTFDGRPGSSV